MSGHQTYLLYTSQTNVSSLASYVLLAEVDAIGSDPAA